MTTWDIVLVVIVAAFAVLILVPFVILLAYGIFDLWCQAIDVLRGYW